MRACPVCHSEWPNDLSACPNDGGLLQEASAGHETTHPSPTPVPRSRDRELLVDEPVGEYVIEAKIGEGSFGVVYRARHPLIGKQAAVKVLSTSYSVDPQISGRFLGEAQAVNRIAHPNIVDIFAFGRLPDGRLYYVMEYLDGQSLERYLEDRKRLSISETAKLLRPIARALDAAHAKAVAHRDLKPANVVLGRSADGEVVPKLVDFGIAKILGTDRPSPEKTDTGSPIGTPYYMSPEQCRAAGVDARTDLYAFGVMLFQMLTGELPFKGPSFLDIMMSHVEKPPPTPSSIRPSLGKAVDQLVLQLLAKRPEGRPLRLVPVVDELEMIARRSFDLDAAPIPDIEVTAPGPKPSNQRGLILAALLGLAAAAAVVYSTSPTRPVETAALPATPEEVVEAPPDAGESPDANDATVHLEVRGSPVGATVFSGGREIGRLPLAIDLPRSDGAMILTVRAPGYVTFEEAWWPKTSGTINVQLAKEPRPKRDPNDIEDVDWNR